MEFVAKAPPDGYTIAIQLQRRDRQPRDVLEAALRPRAGARARRACCASTTTSSSSIPRRSPAKTLAEFVALLQAQSGQVQLRVATARASASSCSRRRDGRRRHDRSVSRGACDAITGLLRGDSDFMIVNAPGLTPHIASRQAARAGDHRRRRASPNARRADDARKPDCRGYTYSSFFGAYVPAGTPPDIVRKLNAALNTDHRQARSRRAVPAATARSRCRARPSRRRRASTGDIAKYSDIVVKAKIPPAD